MVRSCPDLVITLDSSKTGWGGGGGEGSVKLSDHSGPMECQREVKPHQCTGVFALQAFTKGRTEIHVLMRVDNRATQAQINKMGGPRSKDLLKITQEIWQYCLSRVSTDSSNCMEAKTSGSAPDREHTYVLGTCVVDIFADRLNTHKEKYVSWKPDPRAMTVDAFSLSWRNPEAYAFPPFCLIGKCLSKITKDQATVILVTPTWQMQTWYPKLLEMVVETPILLPPYPDLLTDPGQNNHPLIETKQLMLAAWEISGMGSLQEDFLQTLQPFTYSLRDPGPNPLTKAPGISGLAGVVRGKLMLFRPMWQM